MKNKKLKISVLIPAHNEEKTIHKSVESALYQSRPPDQIIVVNDGSDDGTSKILDKYADKITVLNISKPTGNKSYAQEWGLIFINGDIMITADADTLFDYYFIEEIEKSFVDDDVAAVCGLVTSLKHNWLTACRQIDYSIGQNLHKLAQSYIGHIMVIPGCAAGFSTKIFRENISFDHDTITEDMDFTYKLHRRGFKIIFNTKAKVYTQDPADIKSYIKQMRRWYRGGWQNLRKHISVVSKPSAALELSLSYIEGIFLPFFFFVLVILNFKSAVIFLLIYFITSVLLAIYAAIDTRRFGLVLVAPAYFLIQLINVWIFIQEFFCEIRQKNIQNIWLSPKRRKIV